jgi:hypothetical protein
MLQPADHEQGIPGMRRSQARSRTSAYKRSSERIISPRDAESEQRKKKNQKERTVEGGRLWKLPQPRKSTKVAFGTIFLMIFSAAWKTLLGLPQLPQARLRAINLKTINKRVGPFYSIGVGSFYVVKSKWVNDPENLPPQVVDSS